MRLLPFAITFALAMMACDSTAVSDLGDVADLAAVRDGAEAYVDVPGPAGVGGFSNYYARQCQWDACGGPLSRRANPIDPEDR